MVENFIGGGTSCRKLRSYVVNRNDLQCRECFGLFGVLFSPLVESPRHRRREHRGTSFQSGEEPLPPPPLISPSTLVCHHRDLLLAFDSPRTSPFLGLETFPTVTTRATAGDHHAFRIYNHATMQDQTRSENSRFPASGSSLFTNLQPKPNLKLTKEFFNCMRNNKNF